MVIGTNLKTALDRRRRHERRHYLGFGGVQPLADGSHDLTETLDILCLVGRREAFLLLQQLLNTLVQDSLMYDLQFSQLACDLIDRSVSSGMRRALQSARAWSAA